MKINKIWDLDYNDFENHIKNKEKIKLKYNSKEEIPKFDTVKHKIEREFKTNGYNIRRKGGIKNEDMKFLNKKGKVIYELSNIESINEFEKLKILRIKLQLFEEPSKEVKVGHTKFYCSEFQHDFHLVKK